MITGEEEGLLLYGDEKVCRYNNYYSKTSADLNCQQMGFHSALVWHRRSCTYGSSSYCVRCINSYCRKCFASETCDSNRCTFLSCKLSCPPGMYLDNKKCVYCPINTFKATKGRQTSCTKCPHGATSPRGSSDSSDCVCDKGMFLNGGLCEQCSEGTISQQGSSTCVKCPSQSDHEGTSCACPAGETWIWDNSTSGSCRPCSAGTYSNLTATCTICPPGTTSLVGADHCLCPAGTFWSKDNSVCNDCEERTIQNESLCKPCSEGTISQEGATTCVQCPSQSDHEGTSCACPAGETWSWDNSTSGSCRPCSAGTYSDLTATCTICPSGTTSPVGADHCLCPAGTFWSEDKSVCEDCEVQFVSQAGSLKCQACPPGSTANLGKTFCICSSGIVWNGSEYGVGSCDSDSQKVTPLSATLIPVIVSAALAILCISLVGLLIMERRKKSGPRNTLTRVTYNRDAGVEMFEDQQTPATLTIPSQYQDIQFEDNQDVNPIQIEGKKYSVLGASGVGRLSDKSENDVEGLYSEPWKRSTSENEEDDIYDTIEHGDPGQYNDRPRQVEDGVYIVLGESADGPSVPWQTSTLAEVKEGGVYNTLIH